MTKYANTGLVIEQQVRIVSLVIGAFEAASFTPKPLRQTILPRSMTAIDSPGTSVPFSHPGTCRSRSAMSNWAGVLFFRDVWVRLAQPADWRNARPTAARLPLRTNCRRSIIGQWG